jgi:hypothetical protein
LYDGSVRQPIVRVQPGTQRSGRRIEHLYAKPRRFDVCELAGRNLLGLEPHALHETGRRVGEWPRLGQYDVL